MTTVSDDAQGCHLEQRKGQSSRERQERLDTHEQPEGQIDVTVRRDGVLVTSDVMRQRDVTVEHTRLLVFTNHRFLDVTDLYGRDVDVCH